MSDPSVDKQSIEKTRELIEGFFSVAPMELGDEALRIFEAFRHLLTEGRIRAAELGSQGWLVNHWVKKGILLGFRLGGITDYSIHPTFGFFDKQSFPPRQLREEDAVRVVPGGSSIREGAYVAPGVVCMPPMFVNVGAYVDEETMIDSHALVGSCAQVGKRVHLSAGAQIGGVLEPVGARPVIIEDEVLIGGNCGVYEGTLVQRGAVVAAGTILTRSVSVYDLVREKLIKATDAEPLTIPSGAVVVPGSRPARGGFALKHSLSVATAIIVKYRDPGTDAAVELEEALR